MLSGESTEGSSKDGLSKEGLSKEMDSELVSWSFLLPVNESIAGTLLILTAKSTKGTMT